jgi:Tetratricopeptide repeat
MSHRKIFSLAVGIVVSFSLPVWGQHGMHGGSWHGPHGGGVVVGGHGYRGQNLAVVGGGWGWGAYYGVYPPILVIAPGAFAMPVGPMNPMFMAGQRPLLAPPPAGFVPNQPAAVVRRASIRRVDTARAKQLVILGERFFRAGNLKKADERFQQAMKADPDLAAPHVRLGQVAMVRGFYAEAANQLREAETAQPGWIITAGDIQSLFGEPAEFARHLGRLESYVQGHPDDRDAWLVLGAELFLTGRTAKAADVFKRLDDPRRKSDVALAAFLDASNQAAQKPPEPPAPGRDSFK